MGYNCNEMTHSISIVIPVFRGELYLSTLIESLQNTLPGILGEYEVILVDDCSPDHSWEIIKQFTKRFSWVVGIRLMRNYGQHNATLCGILNARYDVIVTMDDDLQHQPADIHLLLEKLDEGFDVVYGAPKKLPQGIVRNLLTKLTKNILASVMGVSSIRHISAFRAFNTKLRDAFTEFHNPNVIIDVLLSWATTRFTYVYVDIREPIQKNTNYKFRTLLKAALLILTGYSTGPLRIASLLGLIIAFFGILVLLYTFYIYFTLGSIPGFSFLASIIAVFSGAQLFTLGIIGEYIGRIFDRSMDRPRFVIDEKAIHNRRN